MGLRIHEDHQTDIGKIQKIADSLGATESQVKAAYNRAATRTGTTIQKMIKRTVRKDMQVKTLKAVQKRFQVFRLRSTDKLRSLNSVKLFFGLNDMSVGYLKGTARRIGTKSNPSGAKFTPSGNMDAQTFGDGFVSRRYNRRSVFVRESPSRITEARMEIAEKLQLQIEDEIIDKIPEIFMHHFEIDLKGRVLTGKNAENWSE